MGNRGLSGRQLAPLGQGSGPVLFICCGPDYVAASQSQRTRHDDAPFLRNIIF